MFYFEWAGWCVCWVCVTLPLPLSFSRLHTFTRNTINACTRTHSLDMMIITAQNSLVTKNIHFLTAPSLLHQWVKMGVVCCCPMEFHSPHLQLRNPLDDRMVSVKHGQLYPQDSEVRNCWFFFGPKCITPEPLTCSFRTSSKQLNRCVGTWRRD